MLKQISDDLWETPTFEPFPGLTTHAYLWRSGSGRNILFYSPGGDASFEEFEQLGGVAHQYLSHQDEAGEALGQVARRFGARLHAPAAEEAEISRSAEIHERLERRHTDDNGVEVIPTPGHSPGSTCYLITGADGRSYLFTGDTIFLGEDGTWQAGFVPGYSDAKGLESSLELLATLQPDVIVSSACQGDSGVQALGETPWSSCVRQAITTLPESRK